MDIPFKKDDLQTLLLYRSSHSSNAIDFLQFQDIIVQLKSIVARDQQREKEDEEQLLADNNPNRANHKTKLSKKQLKRLKQVFNDCDKDKTGSIDIEELSMAMKKLGLEIDGKYSNWSASLKSCCCCCCSFCSRNVFFSLTLIFYISFPTTYIEDELDQLMEIIDKDHSGEISWPEFLRTRND